MSGVARDRLTIAMPKGALYDDSARVLRAAGIDVPQDPGRKLTVDTSDGSRVLFLRPTDVPAYVEFGAADCGIVGADVLWETERSVCEVADLGFGACRLVVAARRSDRYHEGAQLPTFLRIATKFEKSAEAFFAERDLPVQIVKLHGSVELSPLVGLADHDRGSRGHRDDAARTRSRGRARDRRVDGALRREPRSLPREISRDHDAARASRRTVRRMIDIVSATDRAALAGLYAGGWSPPDALVVTVRDILRDVRARGDDAVVDHTRRWDDPSATVDRLRVSIPTLARASTLVPPEIAAGLTLAHERVRAFHELQRAHDLEIRDPDGTVSALLVRPFGAIGAYAPGGTAVLPSSVLMTTVPAKVAGVPRVVVASPPQRDGTTHPAILFACALCEVDELYAIGGAQAIAALAYGTRTMLPVDKIVGPGNAFVTEAKRQVFGTCGIDGLAGPSEVLVVADASARPEFVAGELCAQAEHDPLARVAAVSDDRALLEAVAALLDGTFATSLPRYAIVERVLRERTYLIHASGRDEILEVIDRFAPEHLSIQTRDPWDLVPDVKRAGALFLGDDTPVAAGDYIAGSNHVLPTSGAGRFSSGLHTADFYRTMSLVANSRARMIADAGPLAALADFEGLPAHAKTARMRAG